MIACPSCGLECRSKAGLASHRRAKHPDVSPGPVAAGVADDLEQAGGPLALQALALRLGQVIDGTESSRYLPPLVRELRAVMGVLLAASREEPRAADAVDEIAQARTRRRRNVQG